MASILYHKFKELALKGDLDLDTDTIKIALVTSSYTPNVDHNYFDEITNEVSGDGYTAGGETMSGLSVAIDTTNDRVEVDASDVVWTEADGFTAAGAVIYKSTGVSSTSPLIMYVDFGGDKVAGGDTFTIQWNSEGIFAL